MWLEAAPTMQLMQLVQPSQLAPWVTLAYPIHSYVSDGGRLTLDNTTYHPWGLDGSSSSGRINNNHSTHHTGHDVHVYHGKGPDDLLFVLFWAVAFTAARECLMRGVFRPGIRWYLARLDGSSSSSNGTAPTNPRKYTLKEQKMRNRVIVRFAEQAWTCTYYTIAWSLGFVSTWHNPTLTYIELD